MRALLSLVMIVRNESKSIRAAIESALPAVDHITVLDTGSTDGTQEIVRSFPNALLFEEPFVPFEPLLPGRRVIDYAATRNRVLEIESAGAMPAEFALSLSGDEVLTGAEKLRAHVSEIVSAPVNAVGIEMESGTARWIYPRLLRIGGGWKYQNAVHETPLPADLKEVSGKAPSGVRIVHSESDQSRKQSRFREVDLPILDYLANDETQTLEHRAQSIWFLAETHMALAGEKKPGSAWLTHMMCAASLYWRWAEIGDAAGNSTKANYARYRFLNTFETIGLYGHAEILPRLEALAEIAPWIPEVRYMIASHAAALDARRGLHLAEESIRAAREARDKPSPFPSDTRLEWLSCRIAAACAKEQGMAPRARMHAETGIAAGGPPEAFAEFFS